LTCARPSRATPRASRRCPSRRREVFADLSKNLLDAATLRLLVELAQACGLPARRDAMLAGEPVNATEGRAVLHTALRAPRGAGLHGVEVHAVLDAMLAFAEEVRDTATSGITDVVNIGIGGSDLGPQMAVAALDACAHRGIRLHFVSNVDAHEHRAGAARAGCAAHALHRRQQDLHHPGDDGQRARRTRPGSMPRAAPTARATSSG
jgi:glucose-6-phosphate isomerase